MVLKRLKKRRKIVAIISILAVILLGISLVLFVFDSKKSNESIKAVDIDRNQVLEAQFKGDYNLAYRLVDDALVKATSEEQKSDLYRLKATVAFNFQRYDEVYSFASQSHKLMPNIDSLRMMAEASELNNNKTEALKLYEQASQMVKGDSDEDIRNKKLFETKINELKNDI